jgi:hypothetical protein
MNKYHPIAEYLGARGGITRQDAIQDYREE